MASKHYLVVGGSYGVGLAVVKQLLESRHQVTVISRSADSINELAIAKHISLDITTDDLPIDELPESLDGLIYCPGSITLKPFRSLKLEDYQRDFDINVLGAIKTIKSCLKLLKKSDQN